MIRQPNSFANGEVCVNCYYLMTCRNMAIPIFHTSQHHTSYDDISFLCPLQKSLRGFVYEGLPIILHTHVRELFLLRVFFEYRQIGRQPRLLLFLSIFSCCLFYIFPFIMSEMRIIVYGIYGKDDMP